jgi:two-component system sensor kinase FixL
VISDACLVCLCVCGAATAMRMFGYAKREIVGRNISVVVPEPMCSAHDSYLRNYVTSGTEVRVTMG